MRPTVTVYSAASGKATDKTIAMPGVFSTPIRQDLVQHVHANVAKNHRQAHGVSVLAGIQHSAISWGTGRAKARIPRISGGGTHASGSGAYGNMTRGGHMYSPRVPYRRWHRHVNKGMRRHAIVSALAASGIPALVQARGHHISKVPEFPLVVSADSINKIAKTKQAVAVLKALRIYDDVIRVMVSRRKRAGKGKMRDRRFTQRVGPLIIFKERTPFIRAFRNIPGVDLLCVTRLNILKLAPGGHLGRFVIWTDDAFAHLDALYGSSKNPLSQIKAGYTLPRAMMTNPDLQRIINSPEVQQVLRSKRKPLHFARRANPLSNARAMAKLNPYFAEAKTQRRKADQKLRAARTQRRQAEASKRPKTRKQAAAALKAKEEKKKERLAKKLPKEKVVELLKARKAAKAKRAKEPKPAKTGKAANKNQQRHWDILDARKLKKSRMEYRKSLLAE